MVYWWPEFSGNQHISLLMALYVRPSTHQWFTLTTCVKKELQKVGDFDCLEITKMSIKDTLWTLELLTYYTTQQHNNNLLTSSTFFPLPQTQTQSLTYCSLTHNLRKPYKLCYNPQHHFQLPLNATQDLLVSCPFSRQPTFEPCFGKFSHTDGLSLKQY
jgi:hypothetical protein